MESRGVGYDSWFSCLGCDSGFGNALAKLLSCTGLKVYACCLDGNSDGAKQLRGLSRNIEVLQLDITSDQNVQRIARMIEQRKEEGAYGEKGREKEYLFV